MSLLRIPGVEELNEILATGEDWKVCPWCGRRYPCQRHPNEPARLTTPEPDYPLTIPSQP